MPGRLFSPTWIHSEEPPGPCPGPPTPTQPATWPLSTIGVASALIVAETPYPVCAGWTPAYAYPDGPQAPPALADTAVAEQQAAASAAASAVAKRRGRTTSWSKRVSPETARRESNRPPGEAPGSLERRHSNE